MTTNSRSTRSDNDQQLVDSLLRTELASYVDRAAMSVLGRNVYFPNWHIDFMAHQMDKFYYGDVNRLILNCPPRSGKTLVTEVICPAHALTMDPRLRIMKLCYSEQLAIRDHNWVRDVLKLPWNRRLNPNFQLATGRKSGRHLRDTDRIIETTEGGYFLSSTIFGPNTGEGCDVMIIGDPLNAANAMSDVERNKVNDTFDTALSTRLNSKDSKIFVTMQRLHLNDLCGHLLAKGGWEHSIIQAIADEDTTYDLGGGRFAVHRKGAVIDARRFDLPSVERQMREMGSRAAAAQFQQKPELPDGNIFKRELLHFVDELPEFDRVVVSCDLASSEGSGDYTVFLVWGIKGQKWHLTHIYSGQMEFVRTINLARRIDEEHRPELIMMEKNGIGAAFISSMQGHGYDNIDYTNVAKSKAVRADHATSVLERGHVLIWKKIPNLDQYLAQLLAFPSAKHDDFVDAFTLPLHRMSDAMRVVFGKASRRPGARRSEDRCGFYTLPPFTNSSRREWLASDPIFRALVG